MINNSHCPNNGWKPVGKGRLIGVELEVESIYNLTLEAVYIKQDQVDKWLSEQEFYKYLHISIDASVAEGLEITTHPMTIEMHRRIWPRILRKLREIKWNTNSDNVGYHMHFEVEQSVLERIARFVLENQMKIEKLAGRKANSWCYYQYSGCTKFNVVANTFYKPLLNPNHVVGEFRACRTTTNLTEFFGRMELLLGMINLCERFEKPVWEQLVVMGKKNKYRNLSKLMKKVLTQKQLSIPLEVIHGQAGQAQNEISFD